MLFKAILTLGLTAITSLATAATECAQLPPDASEACAVSIAPEAALNAKYKEVLSWYDKNSKDDPTLVKAKESLIAAQRLWIQFRKADCDAVFDYNVGGTIRVPATIYCNTAHAIQRTKELDAQYLPHH